MNKKNKYKLYPSTAIREDIQDMVPAVKKIEIKSGKYVIYLRNGKTKIRKDIEKLRLYLGWLLFHDKLIKTK